MQTERAKRLQWIVDDKQLTLEEFGKPLDAHKSTLSLYLSGKRKVSDKFIRTLERVYGVNRAWMDNGEGSPYRVDKSTPQTGSDILKEEEPVSYAVRPRLPEEQKIGSIRSLKGSRGEIKMVPVHSWASAGKAHDYQDMSDFIDEDVPTTHRDPHAFALMVEGDSMEPSFLAGDFIILAPHSEPRNGDLVVARLRGSDGVLFKEYRVQPNGSVVLISYNPKYPEQVFRKADFLYLYPVVGMYRKTVR